LFQELFLDPTVAACYERSIAELQKQQNELDGTLKEYRNDDIDLLKSIPGIGEVAFKTVYAAISTIKRFQRAKQLTSYCGLVPSVGAAVNEPIMGI